MAVSRICGASNHLVIWYTGNELKVLRDPTGNRRFIIVYSEKPIDETWLRKTADQLWAQAYVDMEKLRAEYLEEMKRKDRRRLSKIS